MLLKHGKEGEDQTIKVVKRNKTEAPFQEIGQFKTGDSKTHLGVGWGGKQGWVPAY